MNGHLFNIFNDSISSCFYDTVGNVLILSLCMYAMIKTFFCSLTLHRNFVGFSD